MKIKLTILILSWSSDNKNLPYDHRNKLKKLSKRNFIMVKNILKTFTAHSMSLPGFCLDFLKDESCIWIIDNKLITLPATNKKEQINLLNFVFETLSLMREDCLLRSWWGNVGRLIFYPKWLIYLTECKL